MRSHVRWYFQFLILLVIAFPAGAQRAALRRVSKPNLDVHMYRRCYTPDEEVALNLTTYNLHTVTFSLYRLDLPSLIPTSKALEDFGKRIRGVDVGRLRTVRTWKYGLGTIYPDQWTERQAPVKHLAPGAYLVRVRGGGVEKRTWLAVTEIALLAKRSRQELLVYAAQAHSGQPVSDLQLTVTDAQGNHVADATDRQGICRLKLAADQANAWIYGMKRGSPAFVLAGAPGAPEPYTAYVVTDRPVYRPGHKVQYKGTIRQRVEADAPGGFRYVSYANREATIEIRDATDALLAQRKVTTNAYGSFDGSFQLASEPTLGNWQIVTSIGAFRTYTRFAVEEYRKPEYTVGVLFAQPHAPGGTTVTATIDARYYFGQPVANAPVNYTINFQPEYTPGANATPEPPFAGQGVTDAQGQLKLEIRTQRLPINRTLNVQATVTDLSRRQQQAAGNMRITAGLFQLRLETDKSVYRAGEHAVVTVYAEDYDGHPVATQARIELAEIKYDREHRPYTEKTTRNIATDATGKGAVNFPLPRPGYLTLTAQAFDSEHSPIQAISNIWVAGEEDDAYDYPTLVLMPDRASYRPGDTATLLLNTSLVAPKSGGKRAPQRRRQPVTDNQRPIYHQAWALVTVEGERLYEQRLIRLDSRSTTLRVPLTASHFPSIQVSVTILQEKQIYQQQVRLTVEREEQKLSVSVTPDKERYQPGETATYTVTTRNSAGAPVPAEVGLGVVDASIYAIQPDSAPDIRDYFYSGQEIRIQTDFSFAAQYSGGAFQTMPQAAATPAPGSSPIRVRRQFADTAYWNPFVTTDADGTARVSFTMPDNLTTWRATARGVSLQTAVGSTTHETVATMPLLVRLTLPRFYVQDDQAVVSAIVHNYTGVDRDVAVHIETTGADLNGDAQRTLHLAAGAEQRLDWSAHIHPAQNDTGATVRFLVTADGGAGAQDATELTLPVQADGVKMVEAKADVYEDTGTVWQREIASLPPGATLTLTLSPSVAASMLEALDYLTSYPYGCAEQTMSSFLPDVIAARALRRLGTDRKVHPDLQQWVNVGLQKLYRYQHGDGGWNWWEFDQTDGDMTAYVLWGLLQARDAGYLVDEQRLRRGTEALLNLLQNQGELNRRAEWLLTLAYAAPGRIVRPLNDLVTDRDKLDAYALASLCMALVRENAVPLPPQNPQPGRPAAAQDIRDRVPPGPDAIRQIVQTLESKAVRQGTTVHWPAAEGGYGWHSDDVFVTAHILRALLAADPHSPLIPPAVRWLMGNRQGKAWSSTRTSAEAVFALAEYLEQTHELQPSFRATVKLDGQTVREFAPTARQALDAPLTLTFKPSDLRGHNTLSIDKQGTGRLYATATVNYTIPAAQATALHNGIGIHRYYSIQAEDPSHADTVSSGQDIEVQVDVTADANYLYAMIEEPIPAGCEVQPGDQQYRPQQIYFEGNQYGGYPGGYVRQEVHDNRVVFFFDSLPKGRTRLIYHLHAETPGLYRILPGIGSLVYFPEIRGNSLPVHAKVID
jgi:uncharacterized protein YfaS (alpha-2-macroglobulin family)